MNGIDKIKDRIEADAKQEIAAIEAESAQQIARITATYEEQAAALRQEAQQRGERLVQERLERLESAAAMEQSKQRLACKQGCIDEAFRQAGERLKSMPREEYAALLAQIAAAEGSGDEELVLSSADAREIGQLVVEKANAAKAGASFTLSGQTRELEDGGLVLKKGDVEMNCSFAAQLTQLRQSMAAEVAAILFD